jgi:AcrR family transcriptional regulator
MPAKPPKAKPSPTQPAPKRAAQRIRETASDLFYHQGIRAVGVDEIVNRAGVTKPSLYRSFPSKDELAGAYLRDYSEDFFRRFDAAAAAHPGNPRGQILAWLGRSAERAQLRHYRGCGLTNAAVEYPEHDHPARRAAEANKRELRARLTDMARDMGAADPQALGDGLMLLMEGVYAAGQLFETGGPTASVVDTAERLIASHLEPQTN